MSLIQEIVLWFAGGVLFGALMVLIHRASMALVPPPPVFLPRPIPVYRPDDRDGLETCLTCLCLVAVKNWDEHAEYHQDSGLINAP